MDVLQKGRWTIDAIPRNSSAGAARVGIRSSRKRETGHRLRAGTKLGGMFILGLAVLISIGSSGAKAQSIASGPLRVDSCNPRYFTDGSGKAIYMTGAHTWANLVDMGLTDPPTSL